MSSRNVGAVVRGVIGLDVSILYCCTNIHQSSLPIYSQAALQHPDNDSSKDTGKNTAALDCMVWGDRSKYDFNMLAQLQKVSHPLCLEIAIFDCLLIVIKLMVHKPIVFPPYSVQDRQLYSPEVYRSVETASPAFGHLLAIAMAARCASTGLSWWACHSEVMFEEMFPR